MLMKLLQNPITPFVCIGVIVAVVKIVLSATAGKK